MNPPKVSVVINCYNGEAYLREAIDSVLAQTFQDWEIVFWDNASTDSSTAIAKSYGDDRIRCFRGEINTTLGEARNQALAQCRGFYIALLDADDMWDPRKLELQTSLMEKNTHVGLTFTETIYVMNRTITNKTFFSTYPPQSGKVFEALLTKRNFVLCSSIVARKELVEQIGGFDPDLKSAEDLDFLLKIAQLTEFDYLKKPLVLYRLHGNNFMVQYTDVGVRECITITKYYLSKVSALSLRFGLWVRLALLYFKLLVLIPVRRTLSS